MTMSAILLLLLLFCLLAAPAVALGCGHSQGKGLVGTVRTSCMPFLGPYAVPLVKKRSVYNSKLGYNQ